jgi:hypothetical protein
VRGYHEPFALSVAWQIPLRPRRSVLQAVFLCIGTLVANVLICRDEGRPEYQRVRRFRSASVVLAYGPDADRRAWSTIRRQSRA